MIEGKFFKESEVRRLLYSFLILTSCFKVPVDSQDGIDLLCNKIRNGFYNEKMRSLPRGDQIMYKKINFGDYCQKNIFDLETIGVPSKLNTRNRWIEAQGSALELSYYNQTKEVKPYVKMVEYANVNNCSLGMNIYVNDLTKLKERKLKPFMMIHGGAWALRRFTAGVGLEVYIPLLTGRGFVVFSPFYRLLGEHGGQNSCNNASGAQIQEDIIAAFHWVEKNGHEYGSDQSKLRVGGQSAGGHLAGFLLTEFPEQIESGLLLYPPTDFGDMIKKSRNGQFEHLKNDSTIGQYLFGKTKSANSDYWLSNLPIDNVLVKRNSFPEIVSREPSRYPPVFIMHGVRDHLVPVDQSINLCNAYRKNKLDKKLAINKAIDGGIDCGEKGKMYLFHEARHMFDLKCLAFSRKSILPPDFMKEVLCPIGDESKGVGKFVKVVDNYLNNFLH